MVDIKKYKKYCKNKSYQAIIQSLTIVITIIILIVTTEHIKKNINNGNTLIIYSFLILILLIFLNIISPDIYSQVVVGIGWGIGSKLFQIPTKIMSNID